MLLVLIVSLVATPAFFRRAKQHGHSPGKVASIPFIIAGVLMAFGKLTSLAIIEVSTMVDVSANTLGAIQITLNAFLVLAHLACIQRWWILLDRCPTSLSE